MWKRLPVILFACLLASAMLAACDAGEDEPDGGQPIGPTAYFAPDADHPERSLLPLPSLLALNLDADPPTVSLKASQCFAPGSSTEASLGDLETLNGFGTYSQGSILAYFGGEVDLDSFAGRVFMFDLGAFGGDGSDADLTHPIPLALQTKPSPKYLSGCEADPALVPTVYFVPLDPGSGLPVILKGGHHYGVALLDGILAAAGTGEDPPAPVRPSYVWDIIRAEEAIMPDFSSEAAYDQSVSLATLQFVHRPLLDAMTALGHPRDEVILGWVFNTQFTDTALLGIQARLGSFGAAHDATAVTIPADSLPIPPLPAANFLGLMGLSCEAIGAGPDCPGIATFISGQFVSPNFQPEVPIPLPYAALPGGAETVPGRFDSNVMPMPQGAAGTTLSFLASTPAANPSGPYPVVIFAHPLTPSDPQAAATANKLALLSLANGMGGAGLAVIAIDNQLAGDRARLVYDGLEQTQKLYGILSADVMTTRDNIRQSAVDLLQLVRVLRDCTPATCGGLNVDPNRIYFLGTSMGGLIGANFLAASPDVKRGVLNASVAGLADALVSSPALVSQLAPSLCAGGIISAACCDTNPAACTPADLAADPALPTFRSSAQWMIDPADPINHAARLAAGIDAGQKRILIQQAEGDVIFPNAATGLLAAMLGAAGPTTYKSYDPGHCANPDVVGAANVPSAIHTMLLQNCGAGTVQMQTDIAGFFAAP